MKTGQMLFVAIGGMMLGAAGTLAIQTGLMHYEVSLDIRPRGLTTVPPPQLSAGVHDPYGASGQTWQPAPSADVSMQMPPLDEQQVAEIVSIREQLGRPIVDKLGCPTECGEESFSSHLRAAAGAHSSSFPPDSCPPLDCDIGDTIAEGVLKSQLR